MQFDVGTLARSAAPVCPSPRHNPMRTRSQVACDAALLMKQAVEIAFSNPSLHVGTGGRLPKLATPRPAEQAPSSMPARSPVGGVQRFLRLPPHLWQRCPTGEAVEPEVSGAAAASPMDRARRQWRSVLLPPPLSSQTPPQQAGLRCFHSQDFQRLRMALLEHPHQG